MLAKYPGITVVGGIAMAFAIWFGTVTFELLGLFVSPRLPLPGRLAPILDDLLLAGTRGP